MIANHGTSLRLVDAESPNELEAPFPFLRY